MYEMDHDKYTSVKGSDNDYFNLTNTVLLQAQYYCDNARSDFSDDFKGEYNFTDSLKFAQY